MEDYSLGYVPNLSAKISSVRDSNVVCTIVYTIPIGFAGGESFSARYINDSWYRLEFDFSTRLQIHKYGYTYKGFRVDNWNEWTGYFHTYFWASNWYISEANFRMEYIHGALNQTYLYQSFYVYYDTEQPTGNLLEIHDFEQIEI